MNKLENLKDTEDVPIVVASGNGLISHVNRCFETTFKWKSAELVGELLTVIMPEKFRDSHAMGFSRFITYKKRTIPEHPLDLEVVCGDGTVVLSEHTILTEEIDDQWLIIGKLVPKSSAPTAD